MRLLHEVMKERNQHPHSFQVRLMHNRVVIEIEIKIFPELSIPAFARATVVNQIVLVSPYFADMIDT